MTAARIDRGFVRIPAGQIHYRSITAAVGSTAPPLVMLHGGPGSSSGLAALMTALADGRPILAPDMMGMGESDPPPVARTDIAFYADCVAAMLDALAIDRVDLYGDHTGAQVACEFAIAYPARIRRLVLDGVALFPEALRIEFLARYAPPIMPDADGAHLAQAWTFITELTHHFPWYRQDEDHLTPTARPMPPEPATDLLAGMLKVWRTAHLSYQAAFGHPLAERLALVPVDATVVALEGDPLADYVDQTLALMPRATRLDTTRADRPTALLDRLNAPED